MTTAVLSFFTISSQNVNAADIDIYKNGLFDTEVFTTTNEKLVDNLLENGNLLRKDESVTFIFEKPQNINHVYLNNYNSRYGLLRFYDSSNVLFSTIKTSDFSSSNNYLKDVDLNDVKKIVIIQDEEISPTLNISEIEVFSYLPDNIPPSKISNVQYVFNEDNSITYTYDFPIDSDFSHLEIYQGSSLLNEKFTNNSIKITDLVPLMNYTFKFISVDKSGNKSDPYESIITMPEGPDLIPPLEISNLKHIVYDTSVQFNYSLPIDDDFSHIQVWRGNEQIADNVRINSFKDESLDYETSYNYVFKTVDFSGNVSNGSSLTIKTMPYKDDIPPLAPVGLEVVTGNSSLSFSWIPNAENDVLGYNIYVDDVKINGSVISGNSYRLTNLTNGNDYKIQVSAVDTSGNESELSKALFSAPDETKLPVFKVDTDLKSVAESTENWFSELWLVLAFSSGIPIAFLVGHRIKNLFFA